MPLNPHPSDRGNVRLDRADWQRPVAVVLAGETLDAVRERAAEPLYVPHFATCPRYSAGEPKPPKPRPLPANVVPIGQAKRGRR